MTTQAASLVYDGAPTRYITLEWPQVFDMRSVILEGLAAMYWQVWPVVAPNYLTAEEYPVLARIWDNDDDQIFDNL